MNTKQQWKVAYRAARLLHHKFACAAAFKKMDGLVSEDMMLRALRLKTEHYMHGGIYHARRAATSGRSFSKCISLHRQAVLYRISTRWAQRRAEAFRRVCP